VILLFLFNLRLCFKTENLLAAQFGELEKMYINLHKKHLYEDLVLTVWTLLIIYIFIICKMMVNIYNGKKLPPYTHVFSLHSVI